MSRRIAGFTLIEALAALCVVAVLLVVAVSAWTGASAAAHGSAARGQLAATLLEAVRYSALATVEVVACPDQSKLTCSGDLDWSGGWMAFADANGNRNRDAGEILLHKAPALDDNVRLQSTSGRTRLVFQPNGGNAGSNVTFTLCDRRGPAHATTLVLANDGRLRAGRPSQAAADRCVLALP
ncbi:GspH/FimT family protein [Luteimonas vadosa]|uniref:Type II secretion system protein H n=1 Tax=Luteimonas vadosa TaxID=1165507 RepID=A0ABP9DWK4_9GAMM